MATRGYLIGLAAIAAAALASCAAESDEESASGLGKEWTYDLKELRRTDPALIGYREAAALPAGLAQVRGIAAGPADRIYVCGDRTVRVLSKTGSLDFEMPLEGEPRCVAVGPEGKVYVGVRREGERGAEDCVEVYAADGTFEARWEGFGPKARLTSIAGGREHVFVADAGNRVVHHFDAAGRLLGRLGEKDEEGEAAAFEVPGPYFDVALDPSAMLWVAHTGQRRLEGYTLDGCIALVWGKASAETAGFCGCCNPVHFALAPDGGFVTSEKGLVRVKLYDADGKFVCVVAGPEAFAEEIEAVDVAVDSQGRVLVLDPAARTVRVFVARGTVPLFANDREKGDSPCPLEQAQEP